MGRKSKFTSKQKIEACEKYIKGQGSLCSISDELGITCQSFRRWLLIYKNNGKDCFEESNTNNSYSSEFKMKVIKEYLNGKGSFVDIAAKYNIADSMVISWVNKYNNGEEIKDYNPKSEVYSMKSRKTTLEERIEIVKYALDNNNDYKGAADKFLPAGLCGRCTGVAVLLRVVPSPTGLPSKRGPGLGFFSRADWGTGGVRHVAPPTWLVSNFLVRPASS